MPAIAQCLLLISAAVQRCPVIICQLRANCFLLPLILCAFSQSQNDGDVTGLFWQSIRPFPWTAHNSAAARVAAGRGPSSRSWAPAQPRPCPRARPRPLALRGLGLADAAQAEHRNGCAGTAAAIAAATASASARIP